MKRIMLIAQAFSCDGRQSLTWTFVVVLMMILPFTSGAGADPTAANSYSAEDRRSSGESISYTRYPHYPPYCSTPEQMRRRAVPPLRPPDEYLTPHGVTSTRLRQVVAVVRHGARTPWNDDMDCWEGYWTDPETATWNCELTSFSAPPPHPFVEEMEADPSRADRPFEAMEAREGDDAMFLFEKRFDGLLEVEGMSNAFNGTCRLGQLILRGYEQEMTNGRHLRDAYVYDGVNAENLAAKDERMRLFDLKTDPRYQSGGRDGNGADGGASTQRRRWPFEPPDLYYRVDNSERTIMSGQILLRGLFGDIIHQHKSELNQDPVIITHTADYSYDGILSAKESLCPRLDQLWDEAALGAEYVELDESEEWEALTDMMVEETGADFNGNMVDCLMTTICTDRPLPDVLNDYTGEPNETKGEDRDEEDEGKEPAGTDTGTGQNASDYDEMYGPNRFWRLMDYATRSYTILLAHNDAAYSKLGMGPMWHEILSKIRPVLNRTSSSSEGREEEKEEGTEDMLQPKLALFSGHDSTLLPLMATLGDEVFDRGYWSPYASMVLLEVHEITERADVSNQSNSTFSSNHAFRLIYDGKILTPKIGGCPPDLDLCDLQILLDLVGPFATLDRDCDIDTNDEQKESFVDDVKQTIRKAEGLLSKPSGILLFFVALLMGAGMGAGGLYAYLTRRLRIRSAAGGFFHRAGDAGSLSMVNGGEADMEREDGGRDGDLQSCLPGAAVYESKHENEEENRII